jgi:hypothetical protein
MTWLDRFRLNMVNSQRGALDSVSLGLSRWVREQWAWATQTGEETDYESTAYQIGQWEGAAVQVAVDVALTFVPGVNVGVWGATAASWGARAASWGMRAYHAYQVAGSAVHAAYALNAGDLLSAGTSALGVVSGSFNLPTGNFNPCAATAGLRYAFKGLHGLQIAGGVAQVARQAASGQFVQAAFDGALMAAPHVWQLLRACFVEGTLLEVEGGWRAIETIAVGEEVASRSELDPEGSGVQGGAGEVRASGSSVRVRLRVGLRSDDGEHPFWAEGRGGGVRGIGRGDRVWTRQCRWVRVEAVIDKEVSAFTTSTSPTTTPTSWDARSGDSAFGHITPPMTRMTLHSSPSTNGSISVGVVVLALRWRTHALRELYFNAVENGVVKTTINGEPRYGSSDGGDSGSIIYRAAKQSRAADGKPGQGLRGRAAGRVAMTRTLLMRWVWCWVI